MSCPAPGNGQVGHTAEGSNNGQCTVPRRIAKESTELASSSSDRGTAGMEKGSNKLSCSPKQYPKSVMNLMIRWIATGDIPFVIQSAKATAAAATEQEGA